MADSRNFHTWAYWRWLVKLMGVSADDQEAFTLDKIEENFSNYSAWHERSRVLQQLNTERPTLSLAALLAADSKQAPSSAQAGSTSTGTAMYLQCTYTVTPTVTCVSWQLPTDSRAAISVAQTIHIGV